MTPEQHDQLRAHFPAEQVGKLPRITCGKCSDAKYRECDQHRKTRCRVCGQYITPEHIHIDFVGHADVTARILEVDPEWNWDFLATDENGMPILDHDRAGNPVGMWMELTIAGVTRKGYGSVPSNQPDAVKVLIGDALRNAAMRFGVGLNLWAKGDRADPTAENATASAGVAKRRLRKGEQPERVTDMDWYKDILARVHAAENPTTITVLEAEAKERFDTHQMTNHHAKVLRAEMDKRVNQFEESNKQGGASDTA